MDGAGRDAKVFQDGTGVVVGETGGVVVAAEVAEEEVPQAGVHELADGVAAGVVRQVAGALADAHFQVMRVGTAEEHVHVEVGFHHHGVGLTGPLQGLVGHVPEVCHQDEQAPFAADGVADRLRGVVRDFEVLDLDALGHGVPYARQEVAAAAADFQPREGMPGQGVLQDGGRIDGLGKPLADGSQVADVVAVVVRDKDALEAVQVQRLALQDFLHPADAHARVDEHARGGAAFLLMQEQVAVAAAAAGKAEEAHQFRSSSQYREITL